MSDGIGARGAVALRAYPSEARTPSETAAITTTYEHAYTHRFTEPNCRVSEYDSGTLNMGKWIVFEDGTTSPRQYVAMPVDTSLPHFLGPPLLLRSNQDVPDRWNGKSAWLSEPFGLVCCAGDAREDGGDMHRSSTLIRWELAGETTGRG